MSEGENMGGEEEGERMVVPERRITTRTVRGLHYSAFTYYTQNFILIFVYSRI